MAHAPEVLTAAREVLGYLNFSNGRPDASFQRQLNELVRALGWTELRTALLGLLDELRPTVAAFKETSQVEAVLALTLDQLQPAYREHHRDLLAHLSPADFEQPFLLARMFEAVLQQGGPWDERTRIVAGALRNLNDFIGYRPVAILENGRKMQPYDHERFRPVPVYLRGAGVAHGPYAAVVERALSMFSTLDAELMADSCFDPSRMDELAIDVRAHDHLHPANKRTNYLFGEWDPHQIDNKGFYRRFIIRKVIMDALLAWMGEQKSVPADEVLFDAAAVLCGTMLMASAISGSGPDTHDSTVTLSSLLPKVARQRDSFYDRLLRSATGDRAKRLQKHATATQQPFGHVRQYLNMFLAQYGTQQVQRRHLAFLFARMGYPDASQEQAGIVACPSARFESEIQWRLASLRRLLDHGEVTTSARYLEEVVDALHRGIECGALVDPWNILGFQGQFPLFHSREDSVPDDRIEMLLQLVEAICDGFSRTLAEATARGERGLAERVLERFERFAQYWDRFGATTVSDLQAVSGQTSLDTAQHVAKALSEWRAAGAAAGQMTFWRDHAASFTTPKSYAIVVAALLERKDRVASFGLLMQWLSQAEDTSLGSGRFAFDRLLSRWMDCVTDSAATDGPAAWNLIRKAFESIEVNAGDWWRVPALENSAATAEDQAWGDDELPSGEGDDDADEDDVFGAAYDGFVFRDSTDDGVQGDTVEDGPRHTGDTEFEILERDLEPRIRFLQMIARLWLQAAALANARLARPAEPAAESAAAATTETLETAVAADTPAAPAPEAKPAPPPLSPEELQATRDVVLTWLTQAQQLQSQLRRFIRGLADRDIDQGTGDQDANIEFDIQLQAKHYLLHLAMNASVSCQAAIWSLWSLLGTDGAKGMKPPFSGDERKLLRVIHGVFDQNIPTLRKELPGALKVLAKKPLLYVPLEHDGDPQDVLDARQYQSLIRFLLFHLPRLGLLRETWHVLRTAQKMERTSRPAGQAVTEFDRLFRIALRQTLLQLVESSTTWHGGNFADEELIELVSEIVKFYTEPWNEHSQTMRLSTVESIRSEDIWAEVREFVAAYGADLLHARVLTLGNVRAILHNGVGAFLDFLDETEDPLHPIQLLEDIREGKIDQEVAEDHLEVIYQIVVEKFDRFLEYNTTTTQSDYGERFDCLLDFLRLETAYDREAWELIPVGIAHEVLARHGRPEAANVWQSVIEMKTNPMADDFLKKLAKLEKLHGMRLPTVSNHFHERFVKPLTINRMLHVMRTAFDDAQEGRRSPAFLALKADVEQYLETTSGSGLEVPVWLRSLDEELTRWQRVEDHLHPEVEPELNLPPMALSLKDVKLQLHEWKTPLTARHKM